MCCSSSCFDFVALPPNTSDQWAMSVVTLLCFGLFGFSRVKSNQTLSSLFQFKANDLISSFHHLCLLLHMWFVFRLKRCTRSNEGFACLICQTDVNKLFKDPQTRHCISWWRKRIKPMIDASVFIQSDKVKKCHILCCMSLNARKVSSVCSDIWYRSDSGISEYMISCLCVQTYVWYMTLHLVIIAQFYRVFSKQKTNNLRQTGRPAGGSVYLFVSFWTLALR